MVFPVKTEKRSLCFCPQRLDPSGLSGSPGRGEGQRRNVAVDAVAVALQEGAQVGEGAFLQVDAVRPVPGHHLPAETRRGSSRSAEASSVSISLASLTVR